MRRVVAVLALVLLGLVFVAQPAMAQIDPNDVTNACEGFSDNCTEGDLKSDTGFSGIWESVLNVATFVVGIISVLMIIVGGLRYVLSSGDAQATASAKNTILYAIIGLVVAVAARAIILFVLDRV